MPRRLAYSSNGPRMSYLLPQLLCRDGAAVGPMSHFEAARLGQPARTFARLHAELGLVDRLKAGLEAAAPSVDDKGTLEASTSVPRDCAHAGG